MYIDYRSTFHFYFFLHNIIEKMINRKYNTGVKNNTEVITTHKLCCRRHTRPYLLSFVLLVYLFDHHRCIICCLYR